MSGLSPVSKYLSKCGVNGFSERGGSYSSRARRSVNERSASALGATRRMSTLDACPTRSIATGPDKPAGMVAEEARCVPRAGPSACLRRIRSSMSPFNRTLISSGGGSPPRLTRRISKR
jgi:hypothetical protein